MSAKLVRFPAETVILKEGDINSEMYKIISGNAEVYVGYHTKQESLIGIIGKQYCFGEFGILLHKPSIYTVVAYSDLLALRIAEEDLADFIRENQKNIIDIMRNMANTMMTMRYQIDFLMKELAADHKPDPEMLRRTRRAMNAYGMFRNIPEAMDSNGKK